MDRVGVYIDGWYRCIVTRTGGMDRVGVYIDGWYRCIVTRTGGMDRVGCPLIVGQYRCIVTRPGGMDRWGDFIVHQLLQLQSLSTCVCYFPSPCKTGTVNCGGSEQFVNIKRVHCQANFFSLFTGS